ncbi:anthranilate synthase component II [Candidatus Laterigemmans baculatus]|uniref:anthranilate synthase component II n=1 Tax=Candidatus Laterigemmans baculatus TaxID=2770505 RepID=UPI001F2A0644|nr:aminodeoxychorismate/anthranilate synthase component II [Candidatus Laterigemmans baculatus]
MEAMLILDNYDSFVHNLARYFRLLGQPTEVVRSDAVTLAEIEQRLPEAIVISPGPRGPAEAGISLAVVERFSGRVPILGVCLGHQTIGAAFGGRVIVGEPVHGRHSDVTHEGRGLFADLPTPLAVARYHSLVLDPTAIPEVLRVTASTQEGTVMAVQHREHATFGVQFHPESVLTDQGAQLLENFLRLAKPSGNFPRR